MPKVRKPRNESARQFLTEEAKKLVNGTQHKPNTVQVGNEPPQPNEPSQFEKRWEGDTPVDAKPSPQPQIAPATTFVLVRGNATYTFTPQGEDVTVKRTERKMVHRYLMPVEEARYLYSRLRKAGYERF